jgi:hypothetical protein
MAVLMVTVGIAFDYTTNVNRNAQRSETYQTALATADNAIEVLFSEWRAKCRNPPTPPVPKTNDLSALATPSPFPNLPTNNFVKRGTNIDPTNDAADYNSGFTISNYKVIGVSAEYQHLPNANSTPEPQLGQVSSDITPPGPNPTVPPTTSATYNYIASADVTLHASFGTAAHRNVVARVRRIFSKQQLSPWNWAIFFNDPLEIHPGPQFTVTGWVHTNADLYTGHSTLTFADKVTYAGDWYYPTQAHPTYGFMPGDGHHPETPTAPNWPSNLPPARDQKQQPFGLDTTSIFDTTDSNPNNDGYHELIEPPTNPSKNAGNSNYDPLLDDQNNYVRYYDQASIVITVDASNNVSFGQFNAFFNTTFNIAPPSSGPDLRTPSQKQLYNMFSASGVITTDANPTGSIQDNREGGPVRIVTLDVSKLTTPNVNATNGVTWSLPTQSNFNGIVYIYDSSGSSTVKRGIKIKNGSTIPATGLTVASANPVYLQGDFNTGGTGAAVPSNDPANANTDGTYVNQASPPSPQIANYTRAPCSVIADAVNILSNNWVDSNPGGTASPTTVNTAIVSGNVPTNVNGDNAYSGGAENFPRFLENWTNKTFTYYGSMVQLYQSQQAIGEWGQNNVYNPPTREWFFDSNFKTNPPLGTIMIYNYIKGRWSVF